MTDIEDEPGGVEAEALAHIQARARAGNMNQDGPWAPVEEGVMMGRVLQLRIISSWAAGQVTLPDRNPAEEPGLRRVLDYCQRMIEKLNPGGALLEVVPLLPIGETADPTILAFPSRVTPEEWAEAVGPQIAAVTMPGDLGSDGELQVRVIGGAWLAELLPMSAKIGARLNTETAGRVRRIRWLPG